MKEGLRGGPRHVRARCLFPSGHVSRAIGREASQLGAFFVTWDDLRSGRASGMPVSVDCGNGGVWLLPLDQHTAVSGRTGSGKTFSCAMSSIVLEARRSTGKKSNMLIIDAKSGIYDRTHELVSEAGYQVRCLDLRTGKGDRIDILGDAFNRGGVDEVERVAEEVFSKLGESIRDQSDLYWKQAVVLLATSVAVSLSSMGVVPALPKVARLMTDTAGLKRLRMRVEGRPCALRLSAAMAPMNSRETWACVQGCSAAALGFFTSDAGIAATSESDFSLTESLCTHCDEPLALYLVSPDEALAADPFAALLLDSAYASVVNASEQGLNPRALHLFVDEAARFPRSCLPQILSTGRSRGVWAHLYYQSVRQFWERAELYSKDETAVMVGQMSSLVHLASADSDEASRLEASSGCHEILSVLAQLPVGQALVESRGHPIVRTRIPSFTEMDAFGAFGR